MCNSKTNHYIGLSTGNAGSFVKKIATRLLRDAACLGGHRSRDNCHHFCSRADADAGGAEGGGIEIIGGCTFMF